jgi:CubicO group peptidase (beta-lactamase class C family)
VDRAALGVEIPAWTRDPQSLFMGGNEMALSPLAMLAFAEAIRTGDPALVPPAWVETSWRPRARSPFSGHEYGYGWFLARIGGEDAAYARGYGGQMIYVVPGAGVSVAITSDPTQPARSEGQRGSLHRLVGGDDRGDGGLSGVPATCCGRATSGIVDTYN